MTSTEQPGRKLPHRGWFDRVFAQRASVAGRYLQFFVAPVGTGSRVFGISVSKRVCPSAVARNYCKRTLRAWHRQHSDDLANQDLVIRVRRGFGRREFALVSEEFAKLLRRVSG